MGPSRLYISGLTAALLLSKFSGAYAPRACPGRVLIVAQVGQPGLHGMRDEGQGNSPTRWAVSAVIVLG